MYKFVGTHFMTSLYGVKKIDDREYLKEVFEQAIEASGATICAYNEHVFSDGGITGAFILKESHCTFHTYMINAIKELNAKVDAQATIIETSKSATSKRFPDL